MLTLHFFKRYVRTLPIISESINPFAAISLSRSLAYRTLHPAISATSTACTLACFKASASDLIKISSVKVFWNLALSGVRFLTLCNRRTGVFKGCVRRDVKRKGISTVLDISRIAQSKPTLVYLAGLRQRFVEVLL